MKLKMNDILNLIFVMAFIALIMFYIIRAIL